jgi:hypothetical protein
MDYDNPNPDIYAYLRSFISSEDVAHKARELGIKGIPNDSGSCIVARLLERRFGGGTDVDGGIVVVDGVGWAPLPDPVSAAASRFDALLYPDLVESDTTLAPVVVA